MTRCLSCAIAGLVFLLLAYPLHSQQSGSNDPKLDDKIRLDVVVTNGSGKVASGLPTERFKLLDNGVQQALTSFSELATIKNPVRVMIVVDSVNTPFTALGYQREQIVKYLRADGGRLAHVTTFAVLTDKGIQIFNRPSQDGTALASELEHYDIGLRQIGRDQGFYGAQDRLTISLNALREIAAFERDLPGRKLVAWVSPGWPLLSGVEVQLENKQQQQIYKDIAAYSTQLRDAGITLDSLNSWGVGESLGRAFYYETFLKGVSKPDQTQLGDLGLQVLATQSGGLVLSSSDVAGMLKQSVADANDYYELSFEPAHSEKPNEYHRLQIVIPGFNARTRQSYYTQP